MQELICVKADFEQDFLDYYAQYGVKTPEQDKIYTCRGIQRHINGKTGIWLNELKNPEIFVADGLIKGMKEPSWDVRRFKALSGDIVTKGMIEETLKEKV